MLIRSEKGGGILDALLICILVSILIGTVIPYYQSLTRNAKEVALQAGLVSLRKAVELYQTLKGKYPSNLKSLINEKYVIPIREDTFFSGEYLRMQAVDADGYPIDPFGVRYRYDPQGGKVVSASRGYETW